MRIASVVFALVFVFGAIVQLNDPDPWSWIAVYLAGAAACVISIKSPSHVVLPLLVLTVCLIWAFTLAPGVLGRVPFLNMFGDWEMANPGIEKSREMYGLLIIGGYMAVLTTRAIRNRAEKNRAFSKSTT